MEKQALLNTYINNVTMPETIAAIEQMIADNKKSYVVAINVDVVMKIENDPYLKQVVDNADMVLVDGKPLVWISKLHGKPLKAKISGSDLVPLLCQVAAQKNYTIFIIGGKEGIAEQARQRLEDKLPESRLWEHMRRRLDLKRMKRIGQDQPNDFRGSPGFVDCLLWLPETGEVDLRKHLKV